MERKILERVDQVIKSSGQGRIEVCSRYGSVEEESLLRSLATFMEESTTLPIQSLMWDKHGAVYATMVDGREPTQTEDGELLNKFEIWAFKYGVELRAKLGSGYISAMHWGTCPTYPFESGADEV